MASQVKEVQLLNLFKNPKGGNYCLRYLEPQFTIDGEVNLGPRKTKDNKFLSCGFDVQTVWLENDVEYEKYLKPDLFDGRSISIEFDYKPTFNNQATLVILDFLDENGRSLLFPSKNK